MKLYDKNALARFLGMTPKNIDRLVQKGILKPKLGNLFVPGEAVRSYIVYLRGKSPEAADFNEERAKLTRAKRQKAELELSVAEGGLHSSEDIEKVMSTMLINFKSRLSALPAEEADRLAVMTDKVKIFKHLNARVKEILTELSNFEETFQEVIKEDGKEDS